MQMGMGFPITGRALACGLRPGLGCDIVSLGSGDIFTQMRLALQMQRALDNERRTASGRDARGAAPRRARDALELATRSTARTAIGLGSEVGSLTPGKAADLILIRTDGLNFAPWNDPVAAVVLHASARDVDTVLVGGRVVKRDGAPARRRRRSRRRLVEESRDRIMEAVAAQGRAAARAAARGGSKPCGRRRDRERRRYVELSAS